MPDHVHTKVATTNINKSISTQTSDVNININANANIQFQYQYRRKVPQKNLQNVKNPENLQLKIHQNFACVEPVKKAAFFFLCLLRN